MVGYFPNMEALRLDYQPNRESGAVVVSVCYLKRRNYEDQKLRGILTYAASKRPGWNTKDKKRKE